ncbi:MAG: hypothetical protein ACKVSF_16005 [Alphaproteobacteria bacterium]
MKDVISKAEVALDYPDKTYIGFFDRHSRYAVEASGKSMIIKLEHRGEERKVVDIHFEYPLLASIVEDFGELRDAHAEIPQFEREHLVRAFTAVAAAIAAVK